LGCGIKGTFGRDRARYVEYAPKSPETAAPYPIKRPAVAAF